LTLRFMPDRFRRCLDVARKCLGEPRVLGTIADLETLANFINVYCNVVHDIS